MECIAKETTRDFTSDTVGLGIQPRGSGVEVSITVPIPCVIMKIDHIKYDNRFLANNSFDDLRKIYQSGGIEAINRALNESSEMALIGQEHMDDFS